MTVRRVTGRLAVAAALIAAPVLGLTLMASPAAAASCQGVEVSSSLGTACLDTSGDSASVDGAVTLTNKSGAKAGVSVDPDGGGPLIAAYYDLDTGAVTILPFSADGTATLL
jgi:hypothetical protein